MIDVVLVAESRDHEIDMGRTVVSRLGFGEFDRRARPLLPQLSRPFRPPAA